VRKGVGGGVWLSKSSGLLEGATEGRRISSLIDRGIIYHPARRQVEQRDAITGVNAHSIRRERYSIHRFSPRDSALRARFVRVYSREYPREHPLLHLTPLNLCLP